MTANFIKNWPRSLIICFAYKCEAYIEETVNSVLNQTYKNYLFLIYENGSTDKTRDILSKYKNNKKIIYQETNYNKIIYPNKHTFKPWEEIVDVFENDYVTTIDSDDYFELDALEIMAKAIIKYNTDVVFTGCNMFKDEDRNNKFIRKPSRERFYNPIMQLSEDWIDVYGPLRPHWGNLYSYKL